MNVVIKNLHKKYDNADVLKEININIEDVCSVGIIGESGCGKSTLLRQLAGIEDPDGGEIFINGISPITQKKEFTQNIGVVFQRHNLFPHLSIKKNITLVLEKIKKVDKDVAEKKALELLDQLFIKEQADKLPNSVSGGQAQRGSIARALSTDPDILFLDEPTAALDPILTDEVLKAVKGLKKEGREFVFVTHEIEFLKDFADYIIFLKDGKVCECGKRECLDAPQTQELIVFLSAGHK